MSTIEVKSPTRVDLAGGTLDCWPLHLMVGDCKTINLSIDILTGVELTSRDDQKVIVDVSDLNYKKEFDSLDHCLACTDKELGLVRVHFEYWSPENGFELKTMSQSPVGGGLGGSSSLCISLINAFSQMCGKELALDEKINIASNMEAKVLGTPTGTQDYFPAASPGLNAIHYTVEGPSIEKLEFPYDFFAERMLLVNTGKAHHSGINNWQVIKSIVEGDHQTLSSLRKIAEISDELYDVIKQKDWESITGLFKREYQARIELCDSFTSPEIERLNELVLQNGGDAVKICGAGGGGCVLVWAVPEKLQGIKEQCLKENFQPLEITPVV